CPRQFKNLLKNTWRLPSVFTRRHVFASVPLSIYPLDLFQRPLVEKPLDKFLDPKPVHLVVWIESEMGAQRLADPILGALIFPQERIGGHWLARPLPVVGGDRHLQAGRLPGRQHADIVAWDVL